MAGDEGFGADEDEVMTAGCITPALRSRQTVQRRPSRRSRGLAAALAGFIGVLAFAGSAQAQAPEPTAEVIKDWTLRCVQPEGAPAEQCILVQDVKNPSTEQPVMQVAAGYWGPERRRGLVITLPLGVILQQGIELQIDGQSQTRTPYVTCPPNGCQSHVLLDDALLAKLKGGSRGTIIFTDPLGRPEQVNFSLSGFTAGFARTK